MTEERERLYEMVEIIQADDSLRSLFTTCRFDRIIHARLSRLESPNVDALRALIATYGRTYGWLCSSELKDGRLCDPGTVDAVECIRRIRRVLHVSVADYRENRKSIAQRAAELRSVGIAGCRNDTDRRAYEMAVMAGQKAFLAGDNHAYYICARKYVYISDAVRQAADLLVRRGAIEAHDDIRFLHLEEIRDLVAHEGSVEEKVDRRRSEFAENCSLMPPHRLGAPSEPEPLPRPGTKKVEATRIVRGESGTQKTVRGRVQVGFPQGGSGEDRIILLLDHGHEGDLTEVLDRVVGIMMKMGSPACHMGIIARELGIPAIYGIGGQAELLRQGAEVEIRGATGEVALLEQT